MSNELVALLDGQEIGRVRRDARGRLSFVYDDAWRSDTDAYPLSLSMPLGAKAHGRAVLEAFLWGFSRTTSGANALGGEVPSLGAQRLCLDLPRWGRLRGCRSIRDI